MTFEPDSQTMLQTGTHLTGHRKDYVIEALLDLELTAQVYRARDVATGRPVVLKLLRHDASQTGKDHFWQEATVLRELHRAASNSEVAAILPQLYDEQPAGPYPFLALEYVDAEEFPPLDQFPEPFDELEALELARQALLLLLHILHTHVERTRTEMQLQNFRWSTDKQQLKLLGWSHVSIQRDFLQPGAFDALVRRDLARFGACLYRILTGKGAFEQGETWHALARRAGERWSKLSLAIRFILRKALHPDPDQRYRSAREFLDDVQALLRDWDELYLLDEREALQPVDDRLDEIKEAARERPAPREALYDLAARLDLLDRLGFSGTRSYWRRLKRVAHNISGRWKERGFSAYQSGQYAKAVEIWKPEAQAWGIVRPWRWFLLAQTGAQDPAAFEPVKAKLEAILQALERADQAEQILTFQEPAPAQAHGTSEEVPLDLAARLWDELEAIASWIASEEAPLHHLGTEIAVRLALQEGQAKEVLGAMTGAPEMWEQAIALYTIAEEKLKTLPYAHLLRGE